MTLYKAVEKAKKALLDSHQLFVMYANSHQAKNPPDTDKAQRNAAAALKIEQALAEFPDKARTTSEINLIIETFALKETGNPIGPATIRGINLCLNALKDSGILYMVEK